MKNSTITMLSVATCIPVFALYFAIVLVIAGAQVWVAGSVITSIVKSSTNNCGKTLGAEDYFMGNWFCPKEKSND